MRISCNYSQEVRTITPGSTQHLICRIRNVLLFVVVNLMNTQVLRPQSSEHLDISNAFTHHNIYNFFNIVSMKFCNYLSNSTICWNDNS